MEKAKQNDDGERLKEEDLLIEVLSRLDVKMLLQCKAVSKTWYSLISTPNFIKSHLNRTMTNGSDNKTTLIVRLFKDECLRDYPEEDGSYSLFQLRGGDDDDFVAHFKFPFSKCDYPFNPPSLLVGCVCGLVCVCVDPNAHIDDNWIGATVKERTDIYIWNPATKQSKLIPAHNTSYDCDDKKKPTLGFGFDLVGFDFKVVRVLTRDIFPEVYSLNRNVWRKIETQLSDMQLRKKIFDICLHGFLFAIGYNGMIAFDLNKEVFICEIELPVCSTACSTDAFIADFKDSVAVVIFIDGGTVLNLWTLDDEACLRDGGVKVSWTMMVTVDVGVLFSWVYGIFNSVEFLIASGYTGSWFSYNLNKKVGRYIHPNPFFQFDKVFKFTESLLPVAGSKLVNWLDDNDNNEESSIYSEEVSEESSVEWEDDDERSSIGIGSEDYNEEGSTNSEDNEDSSVDSEDDNEENSAHSGDN